MTIANGELEVEGRSGATLSLTIDSSGLSPGITVKGDQTNSNPNNGDGIRLFNITDNSGGSTPPSVMMIGMTLTGADPAPGLSAPQGGAIRSEGLLKLTNMSITKNGAGLGAGVYLAVAGGGGQRTVLDVENSHIDDNSAWDDGGAVYVVYSSAANAQDSVLVNNSSLSRNITFPTEAGRGGALFVDGNAIDSTAHESVTVTATLLDQNSSGTGGAIFERSNSHVDFSILQGSTVSRNTASNGYGGGVYLHVNHGSQLTVQDSTISGNIATTGQGGGLYMYGSYNSHLQLQNSTITGNTAGSNGGGVAVNLHQGASATIEQSTVAANTSGATGGGGIDAIANSNYSNPFNPRTITISQSLISGNTAAGRGGGVYTKNFTGTETLVQDSPLPETAFQRALMG